MHDGSRDLGCGGTPLQHAGTEHVLHNKDKEKHTADHMTTETKGNQQGNFFFQLRRGAPKS